MVRLGRLALHSNQLSKPQVPSVDSSREFFVSRTRMCVLNFYASFVLLKNNNTIWALLSWDIECDRGSPLLSIKVIITVPI